MYPQWFGQRACVNSWTLPETLRLHRRLLHPSAGRPPVPVSHCGQEHFVPHSCGNRHCPSCQKLNGAQWLEQQTEHLLPIPYFHIVFTLPHELNPLIRHNQASLYTLLFPSATASRIRSPYSVISSAAQCGTRV